MDILCQTLITLNIPFNLKQKKDNIIIIPNGVIKLKNFHTIRNKTDISEFAKQLTTLSEYYQLPIYAFHPDITNNNYFEYGEYYELLNTQMHNNIIVCHCLEQIIVGDYCYAIRATGAIWTITTLFEIFYPIIKDKMIIITMETYKRAIVIMTDIECEILHKYNLNIIDNPLGINIMSDINICYITQDTFRERELFTFKIDYVPLNGGNRAPCRIVEGITSMCPNCNNIVYYNNLDGTIRKHNCVI